MSVPMSWLQAGSPGDVTQPLWRVKRGWWHLFSHFQQCRAREEPCGRPQDPADLGRTPLTQPLPAEPQRLLPRLRHGLPERQGHGHRHAQPSEGEDSGGLLQERPLFPVAKGGRC